RCCALASGIDLHAGARLADTGRRKRALALDLDHAGAAIAIGAIPRLRRVAEMRQLGLMAMRGLPDRLLRPRLDLDAVEEEFHASRRHTRSVAHDTSSAKCFSTIFTGFIAAWPKPQIELSVITRVRSANSAPSHFFCCNSFTAFSVPTRHGVHWPQLSSSK